ncbi:hypothetical protein DW782_19965 [Parabacteroides distasonis]|uniref:Uncharacterized protein n=1 Tax=Parabacteroides distasonis TaxID=823 RepID=A0A8B3BBB9_PARDI|nr:hypothetical protein DW782_19965 [Parabacteroides distasonis]
MPESVSTRSAYKMLTCIYLCRTLLFFAPYADFYHKNTILLELKQYCFELKSIVFFYGILSTVHGCQEFHIINGLFHPLLNKFHSLHRVHV